MRKIYLLLSMVIGANLCFAQFDGAVGTPGCQAISLNDANILSWAKGIEVKRGFQGATGTSSLATYGKPYKAQGKPDSTTTTAVSLGRNGEAIITFDRPIISGQGYDFAVFENPFGPNYLELAFVEVSSDGVNYFRFPATSNATSESDVQPTKINNLAGKYEVGWGTPFNLDDIEDNVNLDKMNIRFVKLVDVNGGVDTDAQGNIIYDASSGGPATGFDLTGVCILNGGTPYSIADFSGLLTQQNTYEIINSTNGTLGSDGNYHKNYISNGIVFEALGLYGGSFACGFGPSNLTTNNGYYASSAELGLEGPDSVYLQAYYSDYAGTAEHNVIRMEDSSLFKPVGVYVSNSAASFGHNLPNGTYFYLVAFGYNANGNITDSSYVYLKDRRNGANINEKEWKWLDLTALGECFKVVIKLRSDDDGGWGMNVPSYFCIDNFVIDTTASTPDIPLTITTLSATDIQKNSATLKASLSLGTATITGKGFEWRADTEITWNEETNVVETNDEFTINLTGLTANTTYHYKAFVIEDNQKVYGNEVTFITLDSTPYIPLTITTLPAIDIETNSATLKASLSLGTATITGKGFEWKADAESTWNEETNVVDADGEFTFNLTGLTANRTYRYKAFVVEDNQKVYGEEVTFTTLDSLSIVGIETSSISLNIYPNPAKDYVNISINGSLSQNSDMFVYDMKGRNVINKRLNANESNTKLDVSSLEKGVYFIKVISSNKECTTSKLIIQ